MYMTMNGFAGLLQGVNTPLLPETLPDNEKQGIMAAHYVEVIMCAYSFYAGMRGIIGIKERDSNKIRQLAASYVVLVIVEALRCIYAMSLACDWLRAVRDMRDEALRQNATVPGLTDKHFKIPPCAEARDREFFGLMLSVVLYFCFAHASWSLAVRIDRIDRGEIEDDLEDPHGLTGIREPLLFREPPGQNAMGNFGGPPVFNPNRAMGNEQRRQLESRHASGPRYFSGTPQRLP